MAILDHEEEEQFARIKAWWEHNGTLITGIIVAIAIVVVGWKAYSWHLNTQSQKAAVLYVSLEKALDENKLAQGQEIQGYLIKDYPKTFYAQQGSMILAAFQAEDKQYDEAQKNYQWVLDQSKDDIIVNTARLSLAEVLLDKQAYDDALKVLDVKDTPKQLQYRYSEVKADIYVLKDQMKTAVETYQQALTQLESTDLDAKIKNALQKLIQIKLDMAGSNV